MYIDLGTITPNVAGGASTPLDLPKTHLLRRLFLRISVAVTNTGAVAYFEDALCRALFFRIWFANNPSLELNGQRMRHFLDTINGIASDYTEIPGTAGAQTGVWNIEIPCSDPRIAGQPDATMVDLRLGANPRIQVDFLGITAATAGTAVASSVTIQVGAEVVAIAGDAPRPNGNWLAHRRFRERIVSNLVASTADQRVQLNFGDLVRYVGLLTQDRAASPARSNALVTAIESAPNQFGGGKRFFTDIRTETRNRFRIAPATGFAMLDYDPGVNLNAATMLDLRGALANEAKVTTAALANNLDLVFVEEVIDPPDPAAAEVMKSAVRRRARSGKPLTLLAGGPEEAPPPPRYNGSGVAQVTPPPLELGQPLDVLLTDVHAASQPEIISSFGEAQGVSDMAKKAGSMLSMVSGGGPNLAPEAAASMPTAENAATSSSGGGWMRFLVPLALFLAAWLWLGWAWWIAALVAVAVLVALNWWRNRKA